MEIKKLFLRISERFISFFSCNNHIIVELFIIIFITFMLIRAGLSNG